LNGPILIRGGRVVEPDRVRRADVAIERGRIRAVAPDLASGREAGREAAERTARTIDASDAWVLPGLVDIHCDAIEKEVEPRPNTLFPLPMAFLQFERKLAAQGITSMFHSLSLGVGLSLRGEDLVSEMIALIHSCREERAMIRHLIHLRYEVSHLTGLPLAQRLVRERAIDYLSFMDHAPGQGQYRRPGAFERYVMKNQGVDAEEVAQIVAELQSRRSRIDWSRLAELAAEARRKGVPIAAHDDDSPESVERSLSLGAGITEFPLNLETAVYASGRGLHVCVGAPNIVRGGSHDQNLRALDAIRAGAADIICSDYHPASLLHAVFMLEKAGLPLDQAVRMASLHPARAMGIGDEIGSVEPGKKADLIVVRKVRDCPVVCAAFVNGSLVYEASDYEEIGS